MNGLPPCGYHIASASEENITHPPDAPLIKKCVTRTSRRVLPVSLQAQVRAALCQTAEELGMRMEGVSRRMMELREMIGMSLELLRALIKARVVWRVGAMGLFGLMGV